MTAGPKYQHTQSILEAERRRLHETHLRTADLRTAMEAAGLAPAAEGGIAEELLRRPEISYPLLAGVIGWGEEITPMLAERLETEIKYAGYIARQDRMIRGRPGRKKTPPPGFFLNTHPDRPDSGSPRKGGPQPAEERRRGGAPRGIGLRCGAAEHCAGSERKIKWKN